MINTKTNICTNCTHNKICKYREETEKLSSDIKWRSEDVPTNISIDVRCLFFSEPTSGTSKWRDFEPTWGGELGVDWRKQISYSPSVGDYITTDHTEVSKND